MIRRDTRRRIVKAVGDLLWQGTATSGDATDLVDTALSPLFSVEPGVWLNKSYRSSIATIEDCEDKWAESVDSDASTDVSTDRMQGSYSALFVVGADLAAGDVIATEAISSTNLTSASSIRLWIKPSVALRAGELRFLLDDTASCVSPIKTSDIPAVEADRWTEIRLVLGDVSGLGAVISLGFEQEIEKGAYSFLIDNVRSETGEQREERQVISYDAENTKFHVGPDFALTTVNNDWYEVTRERQEYYNDKISDAIKTAEGSFLIDVEDNTSIVIASSTYIYDIPGTFNYIHALMVDDATITGTYDFEIDKKHWQLRPGYQLYLVESVITDHPSRTIAIIGQGNVPTLDSDYEENSISEDYVYHYAVAQILMDREGVTKLTGRIDVARYHEARARELLELDSGTPYPNSRRVI